MGHVPRRVGGRVRGRPYRVDGLIDLHRQHPQAVEAALIHAGLRWRDVGTPRFSWSDCIAVIDCLPWDAPLRRKVDPDWRWAHPWYELLVLIAESTHNANVQRARGSKLRKSDLLNIPRPGDIETHQQVITGTPVPLDELDAWLDTHIEGGGVVGGD